MQGQSETESDVLIGTRRRAVSVLGWLMWLAAFGALAIAASTYSVFAASLVLIVAELRDAAGIGSDWIVIAVIIAAVALPILVVTGFLFEYSRRVRGTARQFWGDAYSRSLTRIGDAHHDVYLRELATCEHWRSKLTPVDPREVPNAVLAHIERDIAVRATAVGLVVGVSRSRLVDALTIFAGAIELQFRVLALLGKRATASTFLRIVKSAGASLFVNTWLNREQIFIVNVMMKKIAMGVEMTGELATTIQENLADLDFEADLDGFLDEMGFESAGVFGKLADAGLTTAGVAVGIGAIGLRQLAAVVEDAGDEMLQGVLAGGILYYQGIELAADVLAADARRTPFDCVRSVARTAGELLRDYLRERRRAYRERRVTAMRRVPKSMWERISAMFGVLLLMGCATTGGNDVTSSIDALMREYDGAVPGASVLVIQDGRAVVRRAYGFANLEEQTRTTPATNYRLASVTKQFTAAAILALVEDGKLSLDDPIQKWLPSLSSNATIRHLLTHTSGLIDYEDVIPEGTTTQVLDADVLRLLEQQSTSYFAPGTSYRYSNSGYALLALIVERASGQTFASFLRERVFLPLGMNDTAASSTVNNRAYGYSFENGTWTRTDQSVTSAVPGDGGIYSSIDDLVKWDAALYDDRFRVAFTPATPTADPNVQYGFGWRITDDSVWHSGETRGFRNVIVRYPLRKLTIVVLTNRNAPPPYPLALKIAELWSGGL